MTETSLITGLDIPALPTITGIFCTPQGGGLALVDHLYRQMPDRKIVVISNDLRSPVDRFGAQAVLHYAERMTVETAHQLFELEDATQRDLLFVFDNWSTFDGRSTFTTERDNALYLSDVMASISAKLTASGNKAVFLLRKPATHTLKPDIPIHAVNHADLVLSVHRSGDKLRVAVVVDGSGKTVVGDTTDISYPTQDVRLFCQKKEMHK